MVEPTIGLFNWQHYLRKRPDHQINSDVASFSKFNDLIKHESPNGLLSLFILRIEYFLWLKQHTFRKGSPNRLKEHSKLETNIMSNV